MEDKQFLDHLRLIEEQQAIQNQSLVLIADTLVEILKYQRMIYQKGGK